MQLHLIINLFFKKGIIRKQIDYLSLDIDPSEATLAALKKLPLDDYRFSVITYETEGLSSWNRWLL